MGCWRYLSPFCARGRREVDGRPRDETCHLPLSAMSLRRPLFGSSAGHRIDSCRRVETICGGPQLLVLGAALYQQQESHYVVVTHPLRPSGSNGTHLIPLDLDVAATTSETALLSEEIDGRYTKCRPRRAAVSSTKRARSAVFMCVSG